MALEHELFPLPQGRSIPIPYAATIHVNPCTAYRMLKDFVSLPRGSVVIQNGANSAVGQAVIQLAKIWGIQTVNLVRDRPNYSELEAYLRSLGATMVLKEETSQSSSVVLERIRDVCGQTPILGLNCIGGSSATLLARLMGSQGTLVTYGGMSRRPVTLPTGLFIFQDLICRGFWMSRWYQTQQQEQQSPTGDPGREPASSSGPPVPGTLSLERTQMIKDILGWIAQDQFTLKIQPIPFESGWRTALTRPSSFVDAKQLFIFDT